VNRRKLIGLVASILVAGLGTLVLLKYANSSKGTAKAAVAEPTVPVLKVQRLIVKGTPAEQLGDAVAVEQVPLSQKLNDAADNVGLLQGLVASTDLLPAEQVVKARFIPAAEQRQQEVGVGSGLIGVWITLDPIKALNGRVHVNDTVAVFGSFSGTNPVYGVPANEAVTNPTTHLTLHKVPVLDVVGSIADPVPAAADGSTATTVPVVAPTIQVKLGVDAASAERLVFAASFGQIWLGAEDQDVAETNTKIVDRSNVFNDTPKTSVAPPPANPLGGPTTTVPGALNAKTVSVKGAAAGANTTVATVVPAGSAAANAAAAPAPAAPAPTAPAAAKAPAPATAAPAPGAAPAAATPTPTTNPVPTTAPHS
jgi:pilus assembly protein CpaB